MRHLTLLLSLCSSVTTPLLSAEAGAQSSQAVELSWHAPRGCPSADFVLKRVRSLAGAAAANEGQHLQAEATIAREPGGKLHLHLRIRVVDLGLVSSRDITGDACEDLAGAAAVNLALLLRNTNPDIQAQGAADARRVEQAALTARTTANSAHPRSSRGDARPTTTTTTTTTTAGEPLASEATGPNSRAWPWLLQAPLLVMSVGPLPHPSVGAGLAGGVALDRLRLTVEADLWLPQTLPFKERPELGASVGHAQASLRACRVYHVGRLELAPCIALSLEHIWARGTGVHVAARTAQASWVAPGLGVRARVSVATWLNLLGTLEAQWQTTRPSLSIDQVGLVGQLSAAALTMGVGAEWIL